MPEVCAMEMNVAFDRAQASCRLAAKSKNLKHPLVSMNDYVDLVKSHLMYAVREEVEVLKEQIKELMERLSQLEYENNILRAAATPDTLAKLTSTPQSAQPPSSSTSSS